MADVINLADRRKKPQLTPKELVDSAVAVIMSDWERFAKTNRLNDYFTETTGLWTDHGVNYLSDLNAVSGVENKLGMEIVVKSPSYPNHLGWRANFCHKSGTAGTPDLPFETYARCFNILLFIKLKRDFIASGYTDEL